MSDGTGWVRARGSFFGAAHDSAGTPIEVGVAEGQVIRDNHPAVAGREHLFEPLEDLPTEQRRLTRRPNRTGD